MITAMKDIYEQPMSLCGLTSDEKPIGSFNGVTITNGSTFYDMQTGAVYMYDAENRTWLAQ